jgi:hypothetical protein
MTGSIPRGISPGGRGMSFLGQPFGNTLSQLRSISTHRSVEIFASLVEKNPQRWRPVPHLPHLYTCFPLTLPLT